MVQHLEKDSLDVAIKPAYNESFNGGNRVGERNFEINCISSGRPSLYNIVTGFRECRASSTFRTRVIGSGPASRGHDLRAVVARCNDGLKAFKDEKLWDVSLDWDDRMG